MITTEGKKVCWRVEARWRDQRYPYSDLGVDWDTPEKAQKLYDELLAKEGRDLAKESELRIIKVTITTQVEVVLEQYPSELKFPILQKLPVIPPHQLSVDMVGTYRLIPAGTKIFSVANQLCFNTVDDIIVKITHLSFSPDGIFVRPQWLQGNFPGFIPNLIDCGTDEYHITFKDTQPYQVPQYKEFAYTFNTKK